MAIQALTIHHGYACRHAGACCTAGWTIPIEVDTWAAVARASRAGVLAPPRPAREPWQLFPEFALAGRRGVDAVLQDASARGAEYAGLLASDASGRCVFHHEPGSGTGGRCEIHRRLGHAALPVACRQFPRVVVLRPHAIAVSLSHFCPTAAALLFRDDVPLAVSDDPPSCPPDQCREGLDARRALPPLLRADALFGWSAFDRWERFVVAVLAEETIGPERALARIASAAERLRAWTVGEGDFDAWTVSSLAAAATNSREPCRDPLPEAAPAAALDADAVVRAAVPPALCTPSAPGAWEFEHRWHDRVRPAWPSYTRVVCRYLAARAWASWVAHESGGVRGYVRWLCCVLGVLRVQCAKTVPPAGGAFDDRSMLLALREADRLLVHLAEPEALSVRLGGLDAVPLGSETARARLTAPLDGIDTALDVPGTAPPPRGRHGPVEWQGPGASAGRAGPQPGMEA
jgi:hypothetical protein